MSTVKANNVQVGQSGTATNNFTLYQPSTPDGTVRLAVGNSGATSADVLTANSSGNVGIGTSSPDRPLVVYSATTAGQNPWNGSQANLYDSRAMAAGVGGTLQLTGNYTTGGANALMAWIRASKKTATSGDYDGDLLLGARNGDIKLYTAASPTIDGTNQVFTVKTGGTVILNGGSSSATGTGITFPATQSASSDANTLDDYEEGTWTPSIGGNATYGGDRGGRYVKVGKVVTVWGKIQITTKGTGSATTISGLPFTSANLGLESSGSTTYYSSLAVNVITPQAYVDTNSTSVQFYSATSAGTSVGSTSSIFGDGSRIYFTVTYETST